MFHGFNKKSTEFLWGIRLNNDRGWFLEHKQDYKDTVDTPLRALADDVWSRLTDEDGLEIGYRVSRIYRDARRVRDGRPYKDSLWFSLEKDHEDWQSKPVFFFEISPEGYMIGMGMYQATPAYMKRFRARLDAHPAEFERIVADLSAQMNFDVHGEEYKRPKAEKDGILADWYNRKSIAVMTEGQGHAKLYKPGFVNTLCDEFRKLIPLYNFLVSLEDVPNQTETD